MSRVDIRDQTALLDRVRSYIRASSSKERRNQIDVQIDLSDASTEKSVAVEVWFDLSVPVYEIIRAGKRIPVELATFTACKIFCSMWKTMFVVFGTYAVNYSIVTTGWLVLQALR